MGLVGTWAEMFFGDPTVQEELRKATEPPAVPLPPLPPTPEGVPTAETVLAEYGVKAVTAQDVQGGVLTPVVGTDYATPDMDDASQVSFLEPNVVGILGGYQVQNYPTGTPVASADEVVAQGELAGSFVDPYIVQPVVATTPAFLDYAPVERQTNWSMGAFVAALVGGFLLYQWWR